MSEAHLHVVADPEPDPEPQPEEAKFEPHCSRCGKYADVPGDVAGEQPPPPYYCGACRAAAPACIMKRLSEWLGDDPDEGRQRSYDLAVMAVKNTRK